MKSFIEQKSFDLRGQPSDILELFRSYWKVACTSVPWGGIHLLDLILLMLLNAEDVTLLIICAGNFCGILGIYREGR